MLRSFRSAAAIAVAGAGARSSRRIPRSGLYLRQFASSSSSSASRPSHLGLIGVGAVVGGLIASLGFDELTRSNEPVQMEPKATNPTTTTSPSTPTSTSTSSSPSKPTSPQTSTLAQSNHNEIKSTPSTEAHAPLGTPPSTAAPTAGDDFKSTPITRNPSPATTASSSSSDDDFDEEVEFAKWKKEQETGVSAEPNPYSGRPHVRNIVASEIPALIESRESDVLLQIYAPWCGACKMMAPIVDSIAEVMKTVDSETKTSNPLQVFVMDGEANVLPGFLTEEENRALPLIKFFPRCGSKNAATKEAAGCQSSVYPGRPNVEALIEFIHQAKEAAAKETSAPSTDSGVFPLPLAHSIGRSIEPKTHVAVESALVRRFEADSAEMPALKLHEIAPCGDELNLLMRRFMLSGYTSYLPPNEDEEEGKKLFTAYRACTDRESEKIEEFWLQVKKQTDEALEQIQTKKAMKAEEEKKAKEQLDAAKSNGAIITTSATEPATPKTETQ